VLVNIRFQVLFHSPPGVLFTFPSQYCSTIGHQVVFRLGEWSPRLLCGFLVSADTLDTARYLPVSPKRLSLAPVAFPTAFGYGIVAFCSPKPRRYCYLRFGLFRFRSPLLTESLLISLPMGT
jgi:hypothetical protein